MLLCTTSQRAGSQARKGGYIMPRKPIVSLVLVLSIPVFLHPEWSATHIGYQL